MDGGGFRDRAEAGRQLAERLKGRKMERPMVLGLARGGVVVAHEIAIELGAEEDVLVARKVGFPAHLEYGIGAVAPDGVVVFDPATLARVGIKEEQFVELATAERRVVDERLAAYRNRTEPPAVKGRTAIIVDDGIATGVTAIAAIRYVRSLHPKEILLAVPVCASDAREGLEQEADELICLHEPTSFHSVGMWYEDFQQVEDDDVVRILSTGWLNRHALI